MKTTLDLPEDVLIRAQNHAIQQHTTLGELVVQGLHCVLPTPSTEPQSSDDLVAALSVGHNTRPVGRLRREEIYDRPIFCRH